MAKISARKFIDGAIARSTPLAQRVYGGASADVFPSVAAFRDHYLANYEPHEAQQQLATAMVHNRFVTVVAGRRSGKTYGGGREFLKRIVRDFHAARARGERWEVPSRITNDTKPMLWYWCIAPTYALGVYQRREVFEILGGIDSPLILNYNRTENTLWLRGGILIEFKTADRPLRLVGSGLHGVWCDEAARIKADAWEDNIRPALSDHKGWALFTTTPLGKNWVYEQLWNVEREGFANVWFRTVDNTALPHLVEEVAEARATLSKAVFLRNYEASFDAFAGKIFEDFVDDSTHVISALPKSTFVRRFGGIDWGHSNPGAQLDIAVAANGSLWVTHEEYIRELPISPIPDAPFMDCWINRYRKAQRRGVAHFWADPSEPSNITQCRLSKLDVRRADNAVNAGIDTLATLLKPVQRKGGHVAPSLFIHESCENLRRELAGYRWGENGKPVKENDHSVDALRYAVYTEAKVNRLLVMETIAERMSFDAFDLAA